MEGVNLGNVFASIALDTKPFTSSAQSIKDIAMELSRSLSTAATICSKFRGELSTIGLCAQSAIVPMNQLAQAGASLEGAFYAASEGVLSLRNNITSLASDSKSLAGNINRLSPTIVQTQQSMDSFNHGARDAIGILADLVTILGLFKAKEVLVGGTVGKLSISMGAMGLSAGRIAMSISSALVQIGLLVLAIWGGIKAYQHFSKSAADVAKEQANLAQKEAATAQSKARQSAEAQKLVAEYQSLKSKTSQTAEEQKRMHDVLQQIWKINPDLISGFNAQKGAVGLVGNAASKAAEDFDQMRRSAMQAAVAAENAIIWAAQARIDENKKKKQELMGGNVKKSFREGFFSGNDGTGKFIADIEHQLAEEKKHPGTLPAKEVPTEIS